MHSERHYLIPFFLEHTRAAALIFDGKSDATCVFFFFFSFTASARLNLLQPLRPGDVDVALIMYDMAGFSPAAMRLLADPNRP